MGTRIKDHRKYFDSVTGGPIKQSEQVLFGGNPQKYPRPIERIKKCARLGAKLGEVLNGFAGESLAPDSFERKVHEKNHLVTRSGETPINPSIGRLLKFNGFLKCPANLELIILSGEPDNSVVRQYAANMERGFRTMVFRERSSRKALMSA